MCSRQLLTSDRTSSFIHQLLWSCPAREKEEEKPDYVYRRERERESVGIYIDGSWFLMSQIYDFVFGRCCLAQESFGSAAQQQLKVYRIKSWWWRRDIFILSFISILYRELDGTGHLLPTSSLAAVSSFSEDSDPQPNVGHLLRKYFTAILLPLSRLVFVCNFLRREREHMFCGRINW